MSTRFRNRQGEPIGLLEWAMLFAHPTYSRIGLTTITKDGVELAYVSTVWLGIDHALGGDTPLIFETRVLGGDPRVQGRMRRYQTEAQARAGHDTEVEDVKTTLDAVVSPGREAEP